MKTRAGYGGGTAPGQPGDLGAVDVVLGRARLAPRHPAHLLGRRAAALHDRGRDRVVAEHPLHARERAVGAVVRGLVATPEPELAAVRGDDLVGDEPHQRERAGGGVEPGVGERGEILFGAHVTFDGTRATVRAAALR